MKITKKFFDESTQRNVPLNMDYYFEEDAEKFEKLGLVEPLVTFDKSWRVFLNDINRIEVEPDEYGTITTVAYMKHDNERLYVAI